VARLVFHGASGLLLAAGAELPGLLVALVLLGTGNGLIEKSKNGAALDWERATGRTACGELQQCRHRLAGSVRLLHDGGLAGRYAGVDTGRC